MSVMYIRNEQTGEFEPVPSLVGPQGPPGTNGDGAGTVTAVNNVAPDTAGNVTLTAANVGARPDTWTPTASDVGALPSGGTAVNATQLNGKSADQYALKTDTAPDSAKLGGKAPEYYLQPRNLLDNSDFRNPVNQRGNRAYTGNGYTIDRWVLWGDLGTESLAIENGYIALNPETGSIVKLAQRFAKGYLDENKTYTLAYATRGKIHIRNNPVLYFDEFDYVEIVAEEWIGVRWAALYEGEYTADNLPPYVPKGYAAELMECQRYYLQGLGAFSTGYVLPTKTFNAFVPTPVKMRARPTITIVTRDNAVWSGGTGMLSDITSVEHRSNGLIIVGTLETAPTSIQPFVFASVDFSASADL